MISQKDLDKMIDRKIHSTLEYREIKNIFDRVYAFLVNLDKGKYNTFDAHLYIQTFQNKLLDSYQELYQRIRSEVIKENNIGEIQP